MVPASSSQPPVRTTQPKPIMAPTPRAMASNRPRTFLNPAPCSGILRSCVIRAALGCRGGGSRCAPLSAWITVPGFACGFVSSYVAWRGAARTRRAAISRRAQATRHFPDIPRPHVDPPRGFGVPQIRSVASACPEVLTGAVEVAMVGATAPGRAASSAAGGARRRWVPLAAEASSSWAADDGAGSPWQRKRRRRRWGGGPFGEGAASPSAGQQAPMVTGMTARGGGRCHELSPSVNAMS